MWQMRRTTRKNNVLFSCWSLLLCFLPASFGCLLCPLHIPAQPKPLDQFRIPSIEKLVQTAEIFESLCHNGSRLSDVSVECRAEVSHLFCSLSELIASMKTDCPGPEDESECTKCRSSNDRRYGASKWILTWLDSVGKMPSGISDGNYHWLGDYEQCQRLKSQQLFNGRYCLLEFHVPDAVMRPDQCLERSADPLEIVLGICLPANCSADETRGLVQLTSPGLQMAGLSCEPEARWPWPSLLLTGLCLLWLAILLLVSALHWLKPSLPLPEALCIQIHLRHSLRTTTAPARAGAKQFLAISGLQVLTVSLLVMGQAQVLVLPYLENIGRHYALLERWTTQPMLNPTLLADSLLALSAFQLAIGPSSRSLVQTLWRRFIRFWPAYAFVSLVMAFVFARLGEGPMWSRTDIGQRCAANWLPNLLMVQNLLGHSYTCLDAGQLLALEAQFLLLSLLTLLALGGRPRFLSAVLSVGLVASAGFVLAVCLLFGLPPTLVPHRRMEARLFGPLADFLVLNPVARLGPPLVGLLFGLRLRPRLDSWQHLLRALAPGGSLCVLLGLGLLLWAPFWLPAGPSPQGLLYATLHRPAWAALLLALLLLIEANSKRGVLAKFLGWRVFRPLAKQTFPVLWLAEPVALSLFSSLHRPVHATPLSASLSFVGILVCSTLLAFAIDVTLSRPIRHFLLGHADQARADGKQMRGGEEEEEEAEEVEPNQNEMGKEDKR